MLTMRIVFFREFAPLFGKKGRVWDPACVWIPSGPRAGKAELLLEVLQVRRRPRLPKFLRPLEAP
jgi:hypothetical protein